jgi:exopolysaccharide production protein ExoY
LATTDLYYPDDSERGVAERSPSGHLRLAPQPFAPQPSSERSEVIVDLTCDPPAIEFRGRRLVLDETRPLPKAERRRRIFDVTAAGFGLVVSAPVIGLLWLGVKASSRGPGFYRSARVARDGGQFEAIKLRTMRVDADDLLPQLLATDPLARAEYERSAKLTNDPRTTALGRVLRKTSMDELPQLWNVLRGDISLVGPRPCLPDEPDRYGAALSTVLRVKPGLTGLWQVSGRSDLSFDERVVLDVEYATTRSLGGDLRIIGRTIAQLLRPHRHGAY